jgi:pimeloyl-ACP methyl ester carboxylesterase
MVAPKRYTARSPDRPSASLPIPVVLSRTLAFAAALLLAACARETGDPQRTLALKDCRLPGIESVALCGTHEVWEDRGAKAGRKITLQVALLPARRRAKEPDPIVILAGGPGQGAISLADQVLPLFARLNDTRDLVFIDQRGTGGSNGLDCNERDGGSIQSVFEDALPEKLVRECLRSLDADPRQYVTTIAMHDLDEVLGALGFAKVNLWGGSYGTRAVLEFMRRHPQRVRSAVLDGVAPPGMKLPLSFVGDGDAALEKLLADCAGQALCAKAYPTLRQDISALRSRLARRPVRALIQDPVTGEREEVRVTENVLLSGLFRPLYSPELSSLLPLGIVAAADGDFNPLLAQNLEFASDVADNLSIGMHLSVICSEDVPRITAQDLASITNSFFGRSLVDDFLGACKLWPRGEVPPDYYDPVRSDAPVLILSGGIDPATPPRHGELVAASLPNARHLVAPHLAHGVSMHGCAPRLIERFVRAGSAKDIDASCLARIPRPSFVLPLGTAP